MTMTEKFALNPQIVLILVSIWLGLSQGSRVMSAPEQAQMQTELLSETAALDAANHSITSHTLLTEETNFDYLATAASITVHDKQSKPAGQIFYIAYTRKQPGEHSRPLTFVFNGGPGAASAYLHLGALGPQRIVFNADGTIPSMPTRIADNPKSWLTFTDLVFVDPVGTGYSREVKHDGNSKQGIAGEQKSESHDSASPRSKVWGVEEDITSLSHFIRTYLTQENRWLSPIYLVGESYGGFRVARLSKQLQSNFGISPSGLILISPVLDFSFIWGNERSLWPWVALLPSYAAVAAIHERSNQLSYLASDPRASLADLERIALTEYLTGLATGAFQPVWLDQISRLSGLDKDTWLRWAGRIPPARFVKALLADQHRLLSLYDGSIKLVDPDPTRQLLSGDDLYLDRLNAPVTAAFNSYVRDRLNFKTDLPYLLLNKDVSESWNWRSGIRGQQGYIETVTDLKQAMSLNPDMKTLIMHGVFDLVTPYYASEIVVKQMALDQRLSDNIQLKVYHGGHMPYLHQDTLDALFQDAVQFYKLASR